MQAAESGGLTRRGEGGLSGGGVEVACPATRGGGVRRDRAASAQVVRAYGSGGWGTRGHGHAHRIRCTFRAVRCPSLRAEAADVQVTPPTRECESGWRETAGGADRRNAAR